MSVGPPKAARATASGPARIGRADEVSRPGILTAVSVVLFIIAGFGALVGLLLLLGIGNGSVLPSYEGPAAVVALIGLTLGGLSIAAGVQLLALKRNGKVLAMWAVGVSGLWSLAMMFGDNGFVGLVGLLLSGFVAGNLQEHDGLFSRR